MITALAILIVAASVAGLPLFISLIEPVSSAKAWLVFYLKLQVMALALFAFFMAAFYLWVQALREGGI